MNRHDVFKIVNFIPVVALFSLITVVCLWIWAISPKIRELDSVKKDIDSKENLVEWEKEHYSNLNAIKESLIENASELAKIDSSLPFSPDIPSLLNFVQKTASQSGVIVGSLGDYNITEPTEGNVKKIDFSIQITSSYDDLKGFISALESSSRLIEISKISLSLAKDEEEIFDTTLELRTFSY